MSKLLYAWEFGANFGHIGAFLPLARTRRQRGHEVHWAVSLTAPAAAQPQALLALADAGYKAINPRIRRRTMPATHLVACSVVNKRFPC